METDVTKEELSVNPTDEVLVEEELIEDEEESLEEEPLPEWSAENIEVEAEPRNIAPTEMDKIFDVVANTKKPSSDEYIAIKARELAAVENALPSDQSKEELKSEITRSLNVGDVDMSVEARLRAYSEKVTGELSNYLNNSNTTDPAEAERILATQDALNTSEPIYSGAVALSQAMSDVFFNEPLAEFTQRSIESRNYAADYFQSAADKRGVLQNITDGIGVLLDPILLSFDMADLGSIDPSATGPTGIHKLANFISGFQSMDPEAQKAAIPDVVDAAWEAYGDNEYKVAGLISLLYDKDYKVTIGTDVAIDAATVGFGLIKPLMGAFKLAKGIKQMNTLRSKLKVMGNKKSAIDETKGETDQYSSALDADPMNHEDAVWGADSANDGLSHHVDLDIDNIRNNVIQPLKDLQKEGSFIELEAVSTSEKSAYAQKKIDEINGSLLGDKTLGNAAIVKQDSKGFKISYEVSEKGSPDVVVRTMELDWVQDSVGSWIAVDEKMSKDMTRVFGANLLSPDIILSSLSKGLVEDVTFAGLQTSILRNSLAAAWKATDKAFSNISIIKFKNGVPTLARGEAKKAVDELLLAGDEAGSVFKYEDLKAGNIQTLTGKRKYTSDEIDAYYAKRAFLDESHALTDHITKKKLDFLGYKEAKWVDNAGKEVTEIAKPVTTHAGLSEQNILDLDGGLIKGNELKAFGELAEVDQIVVKFLKPRIVGGKKVHYGVIAKGETGSVKSLPSKLLNKAPGYVPRISKPGYFYVKNTTDGSTIARFKSQKNADEYARTNTERMNAQRVEGDGVAPVQLMAFRDRDFSALDAVIEDANTYGGLYTGKRSTQGIFAGDDVRGEITRLSASQSVNRMMDNIAFQMPLNEYRLAMMQKWRNTTKQVLVNAGFKKDAPIFRDLDDDMLWHKVDLSLISDPTTRSALNSQREYLVDTLKLAHNDERKFSTFMLDVADALGEGKAHNLAVSVAHTNPLASLKGATFDAYLGWFGPRQLYIQAQNAALAVSMHPIHGVKAVAESMYQRVFMNTDNLDMDLLVKTGKGTEFQGKKLTDTLESLAQFKRSGLRAGIMRTGDYSSNVAGLSSGSMDTFKAVSAKGRIFFEEGESMARLISWNVARRRFKEANPGKAIGDAEIRTITDDALRMNINMQRENATFWQKAPVLGNLTQFFQIQAKFAENVVGGLLGKGKWTQKEAASVLAGQLALYGTGGVFAADEISNYLKEQASGSGLQFAADNPNFNRFTDRGMMGSFANALGLQNNVSEGSSILAGMDDNIVVDLIANLGNILSGNANEIAFKSPSMGVLGRGADALSSMYQAGVDLTVAPSLETLGDSIMTSFSGFAAITSSWSNSRKALYLHKFGEIRSKDGSIIAHAEQTDGITMATILAKAMGFPTDLEDVYYKQKLWNYDRHQARIDVSKGLHKVYNNFRDTGNLEVFQQHFSLIMAEFDGQPKEQEKIISGLLRNIQKGRSKLDKDTKRFLADYVRSGGKLKARSFQAPLLGLEDKE